MGKAAGAMVAAFVLGSGAMALLSAVVGVHAEAAVLGLVGMSLYASSTMLQPKEGPSADMARQQA